MRRKRSHQPLRQFGQDARLERLKNGAVLLLAGGLAAVTVYCFQGDKGTAPVAAASAEKTVHNSAATMYKHIPH